jgi:hypothetical protein
MHGYAPDGMHIRGLEVGPSFGHSGLSCIATGQIAESARRAIGPHKPCA